MCQKTSDTDTSIPPTDLPYSSWPQTNRGDFRVSFNI